MDNEYTLSVGFGFDLDEVDPEDREILIVAIGAYLNGYQLGSGVKTQLCRHRYGSKIVYYYDVISMTTDDIFALRLALPDHLQSSVRLYKVAKRMVPEIVAMSVGDIENVYDLDSEHRPMMQYVVMNCQRIPQISKASL